MARAKKVLTVEARDRAKDKRLQSKYGITLARQNEIRAEQNNQCKTCKVDFTAENPPCTDHFHYKVLAQKLGKKNWQASGMDEGGPLYAISIAWEPTKASAIAAVRRIMNPRSVRGLLCRRCNRGLGYIERFFDAAHHPEHLLPIIEYLRARLTK
jgi:predicted lipoprotein with Yx(FWY)xxD motif